jgi:hypothetical protein
VGKKWRLLKSEKRLNVKLYVDEECKKPVEGNPINEDYVLPGETREFTLWMRNEEKTLVDRLKVECDLPYFEVLSYPKKLNADEKAEVKVKAVFPEDLDVSPIPKFVIHGFRLLPPLGK